jgi:gamma-glutamyl:cysteine ligase YbdK (ATP-grasp superfamily)
MEKPNRAAAGGELAEARERIEALTGLLDAIAALADQPLPAEHGEPAAVVASQSANDSIAVYASCAALLTTAELRTRTETVSERVARPVPYPTKDNETFGTVRASYLVRKGLPEFSNAQPEAGP